MNKLPAIYIPHGGGPSFFMQGERKQRYLATENFLRGVAHQLALTPKAILIITAHWETDIPTFTAHPQPNLIFDYYGFPAETYTLTYPAPGSPELANHAAELLQQAGLPARLDTQYGWDHGVFIPLKVMFEQAQIPVVAMSLHTSLDPQLHCEIGQALAPLRSEGVLIIGAGMSYHNLAQFQEHAADSYIFHDWLDQALAQDWQARTQSLMQWQAAPGAIASHPRSEHLLPLMVASGAGSNTPGQAIWRGQIGPTCIGAWAFH